MTQTRYKELLKLFKNQRKYQLLLLIVCTASVSLMLGFTYQIQRLVDYISGGENQSQILQVFLGILLLGCIAFAVSVIETRMWHVFRYKVMNQMRAHMFEKLLDKEALFFDGHTTGDIVSAIMTDGSMIAENAGINALMLFLNIYQMVIILVVLLRQNIALGCVEALVGVLYFVAISWVNKRMRLNYKNFSEETAGLNQMIVEDAKAVYEIKTLNEKPFFAEKFQDRMWKRYFPAAKKVISVEVLSYSLNQFINIMFPMLILVIGGFFSYRGALTIGAVILFYTYTQKMVEPLNNLSDFYRGTQMAVGTADRVYEYLFDEKKTGKKIEIPDQEKISLEINIDSFAWNGKESVLNNIHEQYVGGDCVLVQGKSGSGKSTLLKLICGFYDMPEGNVKINQASVKEMSEEQIFEFVKVQFQEPIILEGTIRENIELGKSFSEKEIMDALKRAELYEFVRTNGLDYQIGENGKNLSGGQKQRLALARVLLRKPRILILDEATSALDEATELVVVQNLKEYVEEQKCILVATSHRDAFAKICNKCVKIDAN